MLYQFFDFWNKTNICNVLSDQCSRKAPKEEDFAVHADNASAQFALDENTADIISNDADLSDLDVVEYGVIVIRDARIFRATDSRMKEATSVR